MMSYIEHIIQVRDTLPVYKPTDFTETGIYTLGFLGHYDN